MKVNWQAVVWGIRVKGYELQRISDTLYHRWNVEISHRHLSAVSRGITTRMFHDNGEALLDLLKEVNPQVYHREYGRFK